ncbi:MAG: bifunctional glutamate--cysteine ligase GshA/glutathione synthetase GshB, partial [Clostridiaceae bacterium]
MENIEVTLLDELIRSGMAAQLFKGKFGLEKENVRVDKEGRLALTPHPEKFGDKIKNSYIKTDFSESQVEMITPACGSLEEMYDFVENLHNIVSLSIGDEYLWPQSNPPILPDNDDIPIAVFSEEGKEERIYREHLSEKYGRKKQLISGIHYNFSFNEKFLQELFKKSGTNESYKDFRNNIYLKVTRNFLKYRWILIYLTGASPIFHESYIEKCTDSINDSTDKNCCFKDIISLRNSKWGYKNKEDFIVNYDSLGAYIKSIQNLIVEQKLENPSEYYGPIRLKSTCKRCSLENLLENGIEYLEIRILDLNPLNKNGIFIEDLYLVHLFLIYSLFRKDSSLGPKEQNFANMNHNIATVKGREEDTRIYNNEGNRVSLREEAIKILGEIEFLVRKINIKKDYLERIIASSKEKLKDTSKTYASIITEGIRKDSYVGFHMEKAEEYHDISEKQDFSLIGYEDLELSTQILMKDAIRRG